MVPVIALEIQPAIGVVHSVNKPNNIGHRSWRPRLVAWVVQVDPAPSVGRRAMSTFYLWSSYPPRRYPS